MTAADLDALPAALTTGQAAALLRLSPKALERAAKRGDAPVPHYRWGRALRWPTEPIRRLLNGDGASHPNEAPSTSTSPRTTPPTGDRHVEDTAQP